MGSWNSADPFGNDEALDWADALEALPAGEHVAFIRQTFDALAAYEDRRARGLHREIRTLEQAEFLIRQFQPPISPVIENVIREGIGQAHEDPGGDETFRLIAAGHVILAAASNDRSHLPASLKAVDLSAVASEVSLAAEAARLMTLVENNKMLGRDCGTAWKRATRQLMERLAALPAQRPTDGDQGLM